MLEDGGGLVNLKAAKAKYDAACNKCVAGYIYEASYTMLQKLIS